MKKNIQDELNDAMTTLEVLINSEHKDLMLEVLSTYVRNKRVETSKLRRASQAMHTVFSK